MSENTEELNKAIEKGSGSSYSESEAVSQNIEQLIERAKLEPTPENAEKIFALTSVNPALEEALNFNGKPAYRFLKRSFDIAASAAGMIVLSWLIVGTAIAVKVTSPGPIIFKQQRVGKNKRLFNIYKFRTMCIDTPDLPSHMIDANDWLTPIGALMRRLSLDELPQLWNIFRGDMSAVGPRPALWSQFDLIAERDLYGANNVRPGLTGWAQINGRDELSIKAKAMRDGEYVARRGILFDLRCFFGTFAKLFTGSGVVESTVPEPEDNSRFKTNSSEETNTSLSENSRISESNAEEKGIVA